MKLDKQEQARLQDIALFGEGGMTPVQDALRDLDDDLIKKSPVMHEHLQQTKQARPPFGAHSACVCRIHPL